VGFRDQRESGARALALPLFQEHGEPRHDRDPSRHGDAAHRRLLQLLALVLLLGLDRGQVQLLGDPRVGLAAQDRLAPSLTGRENRGKIDKGAGECVLRDNRQEWQFTLRCTVTAFFSHFFRPQLPTTTYPRLLVIPQQV
jgi:hypothetical protein